MDLATLTAVFGWMTLINFGLLSLAGVTITLGRGWITRFHGGLSGLSEPEVMRVYFTWMGGYKTAFLMLNLVPWLALQVVS